MTARPAMVEIRASAQLRLMKGSDGAPIIVQVRVGASDYVCASHWAPQAVDASMVVGARSRVRRRVIRETTDVRQLSQIVIEGMFFLHHDDHVLDMMQIALPVGRKRRCYRQCNHESAVQP